MIEASSKVYGQPSGPSEGKVLSRDRGGVWGEEMWDGFVVLVVGGGGGRKRESQGIVWMEIE